MVNVKGMLTCLTTRDNTLHSTVSVLKLKKTVHFIRQTDTFIDQVFVWV